MTPVSTSLPTLETDYALTAEQSPPSMKTDTSCCRRLFYGRDLRLSSDLKCRTERFKTENRPMEERDTYGKASLQIMICGCVTKRYGGSRWPGRFAKIAADLMRTEGRVSITIRRSIKRRTADTLRGTRTVLLARSKPRAFRP